MGLIVMEDWRVGKIRCEIMDVCSVAVTVAVAVAVAVLLLSLLL